MNEALIYVMATIGILVTFFWVILVSHAAWNTLELQKQIDRVSGRSSERDSKLHLDMVSLEQRLIELEKNIPKKEK